MGISEAAFTQLLKGQISSIVSSLSAFSNHSHGFVLFILIVLLMIGVTLCLQLPQRSQGLAVSNWGPERAMAAYFHSSPSIDFPSMWEWQRWLLLVLFSLLLFSLQPSLTSPWRRRFVAIPVTPEVSLKQIHTESREGTLGTAWSNQLALDSSLIVSVYLAHSHSTLTSEKVKLHFKTAFPYLLCVTECNHLHTYNI